MGYDVRKGDKRARTAGLAAPSEGGDKDVAGDDISLVESGACGAFVHGLEDEFEAVRFAAIGPFSTQDRHPPRQSHSRCVPMLQAVHRVPGGAGADECNVRRARAGLARGCVRTPR